MFFDQHFNKMTGYFESPMNGIYRFSYERTSYTKIDNGTSVNFYMNDNLVVNTISSTSEAIMGKTSHRHKTLPDRISIVTGFSFEFITKC